MFLRLICCLLMVLSLRASFEVRYIPVRRSTPIIFSLFDSKGNLLVTHDLDENQTWTSRKDLPAEEWLTIYSDDGTSFTFFTGSQQVISAQHFRCIWNGLQWGFF